MKWFVRGVMSVVYGTALYTVLFDTVTVMGFGLLVVFTVLGYGLDRALDR